MIALISFISADVWRYISAVVAVLALFSIALALIVRGASIGQAWRRVLYGVVIQQAILAYTATVRAKNTPKGFPETVDLPLVAVVLSGISLWLCALSVFAGHHPEPKRRSTSQSPSLPRPSWWPPSWRWPLERRSPRPAPAPARSYLPPRLPAQRRGGTVSGPRHEPVNR